MGISDALSNALSIGTFSSPLTQIGGVRTIVDTQIKALRNQALGPVISKVDEFLKLPFKIASGRLPDLTGIFGTQPKIPPIVGFGDSVTGKATGLIAKSGPDASRHVLNRARARSDPLHAFCWFAVMPAIKGVSLPWQYVEELTAPMAQFDTVTQFKEGKTNKYAGTYGVSGLALTAYDDSSGLVGAYFDKWEHSIINAGGRYGYPADYKKTIEVIILDITRTVTVYKLVFTGCWPTNHTPYGLRSDSSDRLTRQVDFSVDDIAMLVLNSTEGGSGDVSSKLVSTVSNMLSGATGLVSMPTDLAVGNAIFKSAQSAVSASVASVSSVPFIGGAVNNVLSGI